MSKIATELEAKTMGRTLSIIDNKCCTKARALELGCQIKSGFSYTDNQLVELEGIEAATKGPIITLRVKLEDIPSGLKVLRIRMQLVAKSTFGAAEPFEYKDGTSYFDIDATSTTNSFTLSKEVNMELVDYVAGILPPRLESEAPNIEMWIQFEMLAINVTNTTNLVAQSNSENWTSNVTLQQSGIWARVNTTGKLRRFKKGDEGLNIDILIGQQ